MYDFNGDGKHDENEKKMFDGEYHPESCVIAPLMGHDDPKSQKHLYYSYYTKSVFQSALYSDGRSKPAPGSVAKAGKKLLAGAPLYFQTSPYYWDVESKKYKNIPEQCIQKYYESGAHEGVDATQNMMITETSTQAMEQILQNYDSIADPKLKELALKNKGYDNALKQQFEKDYLESAKLIANLTPETRELILKRQSCFSQSSKNTNFTVAMHNPLAIDRISNTKDKEILSSVKKILDTPFYRDTKVYLHPFGEKPLSFVMSHMMKRFVRIKNDVPASCHPYYFDVSDDKKSGKLAIPVTVSFMENSLPFEHYDRFISAIKNACTLSSAR